MKLYHLDGNRVHVDQTHSNSLFPKPEIDDGRALPIVAAMSPRLAVALFDDRRSALWSMSLLLQRIREVFNFFNIYCLF